MERATLVRRAVALLVVAALGGCESPEVPREHERPELGRYFEGLEARGTFVLLEAASGDRVVYNPERARAGFIPASTFKIFNSLAALEAGVVGLDDTIAWDGVERSVSAWNQDQRMREAFQRSTVWFYQELARRIGEDRMRSLLRREAYGNEALDGGIDQFWLTGDLRISAFEQVDFLRRMQRRELGFPRDAIDAVEELLVLERCPRYTLRGKTGWGTPEGTQLGWLVGWVERGAEVHFYAMNVESDDEGFPMIPARQEITRGILEDLGVLPPTCEEPG